MRCLEKERWEAGRRGWAHQRSQLAATAVRRLAISTADSAKTRRRRRGWAGSEPWGGEVKLLDG